MDRSEVQPPGAVSLSGDGVASGATGDVPVASVSQDVGTVLVEPSSESTRPADGTVPIPCRVCAGDTRLAPIHEVWSEPGYRFWRCLDCGCESSDRAYTPADYNCDNRDDYFLECLGSWEKVRNELNTNVALFEMHGGSLTGKRFLDVGYCDGAMLSRMRDAGCECYGFDVFDHKADKIAQRAGVAASRLLHGHDLSVCFATGRSDEQFDLIHCREVIEHVTDPHLLMRQMSGLLAPGGLLQVQTPQANSSNSRIPYQIQHLCLMSPAALRQAGMAHGLTVKQHMKWPDGQCVVFQKPLDDSGACAATPTDRASEQLQ